MDAMPAAGDSAQLAAVDRMPAAGDNAQLAAAVTASTESNSSSSAVWPKGLKPATLSVGQTEEPTGPPDVSTSHQVGPNRNELAVIEQAKPISLPRQSTTLVSHVCT